jgi:hypothetical protein
MLLVTDIHSPQVLVKIGECDWIRNNRGLDDGQDLPVQYLRTLYQSVHKYPFLAVPRRTGGCVGCISTLELTMRFCSCYFCHTVKHCIFFRYTFYYFLYRFEVTELTAEHFFSLPKKRFLRVADGTLTLFESGTVCIPLHRFLFLFMAVWF